MAAIKPLMRPTIESGQGEGLKAGIRCNNFQSMVWGRNILPISALDNSPF
jgi:hypothetical protein